MVLAHAGQNVILAEECEELVICLMRVLTTAGHEFGSVVKTITMPIPCLYETQHYADGWQNNQDGGNVSMNMKFYPAGTLLQILDAKDADGPEEETVLVLAYHRDTRYVHDKEDWYEVLAGTEKKEWLACYIHEDYEMVKCEV